MKAFLGGTCNGSTWREELIPILEMDFFNPVVKDWTPECQRREMLERMKCDICLYTITPKMKGFYSVAEVVDDSNKRPEKTILCVLMEDGKCKFDEHQMKSMVAVGDMVLGNGGKIFYKLETLAEYLNGVNRSINKVINEEYTKCRREVYKIIGDKRCD